MHSQPIRSSTERQLELTINAIARSMRKAIRHAEKEDPAGAGGMWKTVEHRAGMLEAMLKAAAEYMQTLAGRGAQPTQPEPAAQETAPVKPAVTAPAPKAAAAVAAAKSQIPAIPAPATAGLAAAIAAAAAASAMASAALEKRRSQQG